MVAFSSKTNLTSQSERIEAGASLGDLFLGLSSIFAGGHALKKELVAVWEGG